MNTRRTTDAAGERWRKFGNELPPALEPDPRIPEHWLERGLPGVFGMSIDEIDAYFRGRDDEHEAQPSHLPAFFAGLVFGAAFGLLAGIFIATRWPA